MINKKPVLLANNCTKFKVNVVLTQVSNLGNVCAKRVHSTVRDHLLLQVSVRYL